MKQKGQNRSKLKIHISVLKNNVKSKGRLYDTMLIHYLVGTCVTAWIICPETYLKYKPVAIENLIGTKADQLSMKDVPLEDIKEYAAEDADITGINCTNT